MHRFSRLDRVAISRDRDSCRTDRLDSLQRDPSPVGASLAPGSATARLLIMNAVEPGNRGIVVPGCTLGQRTEHHHIVVYWYSTPPSKHSDQMCSQHQTCAMDRPVTVMLYRPGVYRPSLDYSEGKH
jgi:hypothetical protein